MRPTGTGGMLARRRPWIIGGVIAIVIVIVIMVATLGGARGIVGTWTYQGHTVAVFYSDGSCQIAADANQNMVYYTADANGNLTFYDMYHYPSDPVKYVITGNKLCIGDRTSVNPATDDCLTRK